MINEPYARVVQFDTGSSGVIGRLNREDAACAIRFIVWRPSGQLGQVLIERPLSISAVLNELQPGAFVKRPLHDGSTARRMSVEIALNRRSYGI